MGGSWPIGRRDWRYGDGQGGGHGHRRWLRGRRRKRDDRTCGLWRKGGDLGGGARPMGEQCEDEEEWDEEGNPAVGAMDRSGR